MKVYKIILAAALMASIIPLSLACQNQNKEMAKVVVEKVSPEPGASKESNEKETAEAAEKSWQKLVNFAKGNKNELTQVSKTLLKYKDKITLDKTPLDYEALITEEEEAVKQNFRKVFKEIGFSYETITNKAYKENNIICYFSNNLEGTTYGILYLGEDGEDVQNLISFIKEHGEAIRITDNIYAYYYSLNYT